MSHQWEVSIANPLCGPFSSIGMLNTTMVDVTKLDTSPFSDLGRSDLDNTDPSLPFKTSLRRVLCSTWTLPLCITIWWSYHHPLASSWALHLVHRGVSEDLRVYLWFPLPKVVTQIFRTYDILVAQLVPNAWASILPFIATCNLKRLGCTTLNFSYIHKKQKNNTVNGGKDYFCIVNHLNYLSTLVKPSSIHRWSTKFYKLRK